MKLGKLLYIIAIIAMAIMSYVMIINGLKFIGYFVGFTAGVGILNYLDIVENNRNAVSKTYKSKRAAYFKSMSNEEQEQYLAQIERDIKEKLNK